MAASNFEDHPELWAPKVKTLDSVRNAFLDMALQFNPAALNLDLQHGSILLHNDRLDFESNLLACARQLGVYEQVDPKIRQSDNPRSLFVLLMTDNCVR